MQLAVTEEVKQHCSLLLDMIRVLLEQENLREG